MHKVIKQPCGCETVEGDGFLIVLSCCRNHPVQLPEATIGKNLVSHFKQLREYT